MSADPTLTAWTPEASAALDAELVAGESPLGRLVGTFRAWLYMPDATPLLAVLGTVVANRMEGDPVWLLLVGPPASGKTETLEPLRGLPNVHAAATITEASLLSGTPSREKAKDARGGLLRVVGERGILLCKDFGSVLSMHRDARAGVLAALREVYDGSWTRHVGTDGGRSLSWSGRVGFVGGCPPTLDGYHAVMASLGDRFLLLRMEPASGVERARRALGHAGRESAMRRELAAAVAGFLAGVRLPEAPADLTEPERDYLVALANVVALCRSAVERDGRTREVELVPGAESPARLAVTLKRLHDGLAAVGVDRPTRWGIVRRVALDSMPAIRRLALEAVLRIGEPATGTVAAALGYPTTTTRRTLEDLAAYRVLARVPGGAGKADHWRLGEAVRGDLGTVPETSGGAGSESENGEPPLYILPVPSNDDLSGKGPAADCNPLPLGGWEVRDD